MNDLLLRTVTGIVMIGFSLVAALLGGNVFALFVATGATVLYYEWTKIVRGWGAGWWVAGFFYALAPALALLWLRDRADDGIALLMWALIVTWATDIGAYFAGRKFGRKKLAPTISPNKTMEGLYGGVAAATLLGGGWALATGISPALIVLAPVLAVLAQAGDLFESWMKRQAGVKDSGNWLPGHGGLLDRLDGLVPVAVLTAAMNLAGLI
ncbi:MAG: phosphatidate cytidylyltransferase [Sphingomicrobium sp.]